MVRVLILSGGGRYSDPWHKFADTSERLAEIARSCGYITDITYDVAEDLANLDGVDIIVANAARAAEHAPGDEVLHRAARSLRIFIERGGSALGVHVGVSTLTGLEKWRAVMGGYWINGVSLHPPVGPCRVFTVGERHLLTKGLVDFELFDERYTYLQVGPDIDAAVFHSAEGQAHPLIWTREVGSARAVADCLGHGVESFDSAEHRLVLTRSLKWLAREL